MNKKELILIGLGYAGSAVAVNPDNSIHVVEGKEEEPKEVFAYNPMPVMPEVEDLYRCIDVFRTGRQQRTARRKAERDKKNGKFNF